MGGTTAKNYIKLLFCPYRVPPSVPTKTNGGGDRKTKRQTIVVAFLLFCPYCPPQKVQKL